MKPPAHYWYQSKIPGFSHYLFCDRSSSIAIVCLACGHINSLKFCGNSKRVTNVIFNSLLENLLDCLALSREDLYTSPLLVLYFIRINGLIDLV
ncbi:hypothetical protein TNCV_909561 [Trichonephila clavipes]|nr:hypothetical protein TNCV_909561 [Trichonephila clavipes]